MLGTSRKLLYNFKDKAAGPADVAKFTLSSIDEFMRTIPVMKVAATRGLEERHFDKICEIMGEPRGTFKIDNSTTFKTVLTYRFETHLGKIEDVA